MYIKAYSYDGISFINLSSQLSMEDLKRELIDEWTPNIDCFKCGRKSYCKYSVNRGNCDYLYQEIQCGVVSNFIEEYLDIADKKYQSLNKAKKEEFLKGLYHLTKFTYDAENYIGAFQEKGFISEMYSEQVGERLLGLAADINDSLVKACSHLKNTEFTRSERIMLLVEGQSEKDFVELFTKLNSAYFSGVYVESYDGKDNKRKDKVFLLINYFKEKGFKVIFQIDQDGNPAINLNQHIKSNLITENDFFAFSDDLEATYPKELIAECLTEFGSDYGTIIEHLNSPKKDDVTLYNHLKNIAVWMPPKPLFAKKMAELVSDYDLFYREDYKDFELVSFLKFVSSHAMKI
ncbi:hypothetical protein [Psychromonas aquimarina]|uniref:hypothetical protein n=1 Tax=Psychromonas aquimarina TaxID=444919 RepID=UPI000419E56B|nr:hypothetical protein [Psychromonas aquimarina]